MQNRPLLSLELKELFYKRTFPGAFGLIYGASKEVTKNILTCARRGTVSLKQTGRLKEPETVKIVTFGHTRFRAPQRTSRNPDSVANAFASGVLDVYLVYLLNPLAVLTCDEVPERNACFTENLRYPNNTRTRVCPRGCV